MLTAVYVALIAIAAGVAQALTGFGCGIVMMLVFPMLFGILKAPALSTAIAVAVSLQLAYRYRKHFKPGAMVFFTSSYILASVVMIYFAKTFDVYWLTMAFGIYLILISIYNLLAKNRFRLKGSRTTALICGTLGGVCSGLFGIGGPMIALYFLAITDDREGYMANSQLSASISSLVETAARVSNGILTLDMAPAVAAGIVGICVGGMFGDRISRHINRLTMEKLVYIMVAVTGIKTLITL